MQTPRWPDAPYMAPLRGLRDGLEDLAALMQKGVLHETSTGTLFYTGYDYGTLYDWDQYFEAILQLYMGWPSQYVRNGVTLFLDHQQPSGHIARSVPSNEFHDPEHVKPFLAQTALLVALHWGESDWILENPYYDRLKRSIRYWLDVMDSTGNGLAEWMSAPHTGMDNHHDRAGHWKARISKGVDLNCYLVREFRAMAQLAELAGRKADRDACIEDADALAGRIRDLMWDDEDGFFYDLHTQTGSRIKVRTLAGTLPLWAGVATEEQARRLVHDHLFNAAEFWTPYPFPALAKSEVGYVPVGLPTDVMAQNTCSWRANTWIPTNYMIFQGLRDYGYGPLAGLVAHATERLLRKAGNREYYASESGKGCGLDPFWGWSPLGWFMPFEYTYDLNPTTIPGGV